MTNKYMFDESSQALHRVVGKARPWEHLGPGVRVRRCRIRPQELSNPRGVALWASKLGLDFDDLPTEG